MSLSRAIATWRAALGCAAAIMLTCLPHAASCAAIYQQVMAADDIGWVRIQYLAYPKRQEGNPNWLEYDGIAPQMYYTDKAPGELSADPAENRGAPLEYLNYPGITPGYLYDNTRGNLLLEGGFPFMDPRDLEAQFFEPRASFLLIGSDGEPILADGGFRFIISTVPEPATWGLCIAGFGLAGLALRRRRQGQVTAAA